jgi:tetratricopeptide (TPR) repeat protein/CHAT domain-containing protein
MIDCKRRFLGAACAGVLLLSPGLLRADDEADCREAFARGFALYQKGNYAEAAPYYERAVELAPKVFGPEHENTGTILQNLGTLYLAQGRYGKAEPPLQRALQIYKKVLGEEHSYVAESLNNLGTLHYHQGQYSKGEPLYQRALAILEKIHGEEHLALAKTLNNLGLLYTDMGQYRKGEPLLQRALRISEKGLGKDHPDVAMTVVTLGKQYHLQGQYSKAEPLFRRALRIYEKVYGEEHPKVALCLNNLGLLYTEQGLYKQAEPSYQQALRIREKVLGEEHPDVAQSLNNLALLYQAQGGYGKAEPAYQRALRIYEKALGQGTPDFARSLNNLALLYAEQGLYGKAEASYKRALRIREQLLGGEHPEVAQTLNNLGLLYYQQEQFGKAEPLFQRALRIYEKVHGDEHPHVADALDNLANLYADQGQQGKAERLYQRALRMRETVLGKQHPKVAAGLANLAVLYLTRGDLREAVPLCQRALSIFTKAFGEDHPRVADSLHNLAIVEASQEHWEEAADLLQRQRRAVLRYLGRELPTLSQQEQLLFLGVTDRKRLDHALLLGLDRLSDPHLVALTAGLLLNSKAVAQQTLTRRARLEQDAEDVERGPLVQEIRTLRRRQSALALATQPNDPGERRLLHDQIEEQLRMAEGRLARAGGIDLSPAPWVTVEVVRKELPTDAVLVEFASFGSTFVSDKVPRGRYAAWIISPAGQGDVRLIDFGGPAAIDEAVRKVRKALADAPSAIERDGEVVAEKALRTPLAELAKLVLEPLLPHIGKHKRWLLSPDGQLWLVPWATLPVSADHYAAEQHSIRLLVCGRDLVTTPQSVEPTRPLLLADPDFGPAESGDGVVGLKALLPLVKPLPGTRREAAAIKMPLAAYTGRTPRLILGAEASKATFREKAVRPRVLVLSTHGYFLQEPELNERERPLHLDDSSRALRRMEMPLTANPLLRCGLLLAGANRRDGNANEGVLTGLEVVSTDLRGCELVVLSACETGVGEVRNGEGVAGLRQAFQLAGAKGVLASLWCVDDKSTARQMGDFFAALADGKDQAEALRQAQLHEIESRRKRNGAAHPYYWAAFALTSQGK